MKYLSPFQRFFDCHHLYFIWPKKINKIYLLEEHQLNEIKKEKEAETLAPNDEVVGFTGSPGAARTLILIAPALVGKKHIIVKDQAGFSATQNITISGQNIDDQTSIVIDSNYGFFRLYCTGISYHSI